MPRRKMVARLKAVYSPDDGGWLVEVPGVAGCHSHGRSLVEARRNIREAIATCEDVFEDADAVAANVELDEEIDLTPGVRKAVDRALESRAAAEQQTAEAAKATSEAARALTADGLSLRDAGELLGISHQRIKQLLDEAPKDARSARKARRRAG